jgi:hypothetical protein
MKMANCKRIETIIKLVPILSWQGGLLRRHVSKCPACQENLADIQEARSVIISRDKLGEVKNFWPHIREDMRRKEKRKKLMFRPFWGWAFATAVFVAVVLACVLITILPLKNESPDLSVKLRIQYIEFYEEPAQAIIFQTQDANKTFIWVEKKDKGEIL